MGDDGTEGGFLDQVENSVADLWDDITGFPDSEVGPSDTPVSNVATQVAQTVAAAPADVAASIQSALPSSTEVWFGVAALIVILVLGAYIAREVAG